MPTIIHPTLLLQINLDESLYTEETVVEIKRSYSYIAPISVTLCSTVTGSIENTLRFIIKLTHPYWDSNDGEANEIWEGVMNKWLKNMFYKVSSTLVGFNRVAHEKGQVGLNFAWLELEFGNHVIILRLGEDSSILDNTLDLVNQVHSLWDTGSLKEFELMAVRLPSRQFYAKQVAVAQARAAKEEVPDAKSQENEGQDSTNDDAVVNGPTSKVADALERIDKDDSREVTTKTSLREPIGFDIDFSIWGLEFADGSQKQYNSSTDSIII